MVNRENVREAAYSLLKAIAVEAKRKLDTNIEVIQRSSWMVKTSATGSHSKIFERKVFNARAVDMMYQLDMKTGFPEKEELKVIIIEAGFKPQEIEFGLILKLVRAWLDVSKPLDVDGEDVARVIGDFVGTIIDRVVKTWSRYALIAMDERSEGVKFDDNVVLSRISDEELWEFGILGSALSPANTMMSGIWIEPLSKNWMILEISSKYKVGDVPNPNIAKDAVLINMLLSSSGRFSIINLGIKQN